MDALTKGHVPTNTKLKATFVSKGSASERNAGPFFMRTRGRYVGWASPTNYSIERRRAMPTVRLN